MLHILWLILKVILILAGIILGLVLLAVLLLLFCPLCYRGEASKTVDGLAARGKITWLFRAISVSFAYENKNRTMGIRIFGISLEKITGLLHRAQGRKRPGNEKRKPQTAKSVQQKRERSLPDWDSPESLQGELPQETETEQADGDLTPKLGPEEKPQSTQCEPEEEPQSTVREEEASGEFFLKTLWKKIKSFFEAVRTLMKKFLLLFDPVEGPVGRVKRLFQKISYTIHRFYDKINEWKIFLGDAHTKAALSLVFGQAKVLLGHVSPRKLQGHVLFGFEDPSKTGLVLAVLGMTMPLHKNRIAVEPVYDRVVLEGQVQLQGRIYGFVFLRAAWKIWFDENVKDVRKRWKQKEVASAYGK